MGFDHRHMIINDEVNSEQMAAFSRADCLNRFKSSLTFRLKVCLLRTSLAENFSVERHHSQARMTADQQDR